MLCQTKRIKAILNTLLVDHSSDCLDGEPSMEWLRDLPTEVVKNELLKFNGVGPKTVSCVLMFNMDRGDFPVDTHVWHIRLVKTFHSSMRVAYASYLR